jgi:hypothetical protein
MKERLSDFLHSLKGKNLKDKISEKLWQKGPILTRLYEQTENFGVTELSVKADHAFDVLRTYKALIKTNKKTNHDYYMVLFVGRDNAYYLRISDMPEENVVRSVLFKEVYEESYSVVSAAKHDKPSTSKIVLSLKEQKRFLDEVDQAEINTTLTRKIRGKYNIIPFSPKENRN